MNCRTLVSTKDMSHSDWLKARTAGIGGSEAGVLAGVNKWASPMKVYLDKIGQGEKVEENERMYWGNVLEDVVAREFSLRTGLKTQRKNAILQHPEYDFMLANVDRLIIDKERGTGILECKTTSEYGKGEWEEDNLPDSYYLQIQHYLGVTGLSYGAIAVLIGGNRFKYHFVERDEEIINTLIELEKNFWENNVIKRVPPLPDGSDNAGELLNMMYPESNGKEIELNDQKENLERLVEVKEAIKELQTEQKKMEQLIKKDMGENEIAFVEGNKITWKTVTSNRIDSKTLKKEKPEIYEKYCKESKSRRFTI